jgi:hypothetical protein
MRHQGRLVLRELRREWIRVVLAVLAFALLVAHGAWSKSFKTDTTTLGLLLFVLVVLLLPQIAEFTLFGNTIRFRENLDKTADLAAEVEAATRELESGAEKGAPPPPLIPADPLGDLTTDRTRVAKELLDLYRLVYAEEPDDLQRALTRLDTDGYLGKGAGKLARSLLDLAVGALRSNSVTVDQARTMRAATQKFVASFGLVSSLRFEDKVGDALRGLGRTKIERRKPSSQFRGRRTIEPDFLVTTDGKRIVVEAYLPRHEAVERRVSRRIVERLTSFVGSAEAGLIVVVPDGVPDSIIDMENVPGNVLLLRLRELATRVEDATLLDDPRLAG